MLKRKLVLILAFTVVLFGLTLYSYGGYGQSTAYPQGPVIGHSDRVLIVAPHPDDETIDNTGIIRYCIEKNIPVHVVIVTNGGDSVSTGEKRHNETLTAMSKLGLKSSAVTFLDYPEGLTFLFNRNWDYDKLYNESDGTSHARNTFAYEPGAPYCGASLEKALENVIWQYQPTIIIYPDPDDKNTDHWATSAFVNYAVNNMNYNCKEYEYPTHAYSLWPYPRSYNPDDYLLPPAELVNQSQWMVFPLTRHDESLKYAAIKSYTSQISPDSSYLIAFVKKNELFTVYPVLNVTMQNRTANFHSGSAFPPTIFNDPENDLIEGHTSLDNVNTLDDDLDAEDTAPMDLTAVGLEMDNNTTWISLKTRGNISNALTYEFHVRTFRDDGDKRIDIQAQNGTAHYTMVSQNSVESSLKIKTVFKKNGIIVGIPTDLINNNKFMINVDILTAQCAIDTTAWRTVNVV